MSLFLQLAKNIRSWMADARLSTPWLLPQNQTLYCHSCQKMDSVRGPSPHSASRVYITHLCHVCQAGWRYMFLSDSLNYSTCCGEFFKKRRVVKIYVTTIMTHICPLYQNACQPTYNNTILWRFGGRVKLW